MKDTTPHKHDGFLTLSLTIKALSLKKDLIHLLAVNQSGVVLSHWLKEVEIQQTIQQQPQTCTACPILHHPACENNYVGPYLQWLGIYSDPDPADAVWMSFAVILISPENKGLCYKLDV